MGDYDDRTALHLAASNGHLKMVKHLVMTHGKGDATRPLFSST
jgi:ankyrin repeat protein